MVKERVVLYSGMEVGHLVPMTDLAMLFYWHGFSVTIVSADPPNKTGSASNFIQELSKQNHLISFHNIPAVIQHDPNQHCMTLMLEAIHANNRNLYDFIYSLSSTNSIRALVVDVFCTDALDIARQLSIPAYVHFPCAASTLATEFMPGDRSQRNMVLSDLVDESIGHWNTGLLIEFFGYEKCVTILGSVRPPEQGHGEDALIFTLSTNGQFSVKNAYANLSKWDQQINQNQRGVWEKVWKAGSILPRVRLLIWKLIHRGVPLAQILHSRTNKENPTCASCGEADEDVTHMLFRCPFSRACWLAGPLSIRPDALPTDLQETILTVTSQTSLEE